MILNQQNAEEVDLAGLEAFAGKLRAVLGLGDRKFNVCLVDDERIAGLNGAFRGNASPTDVLSFPWEAGLRPSESLAGAGAPKKDAETAKGRARRHAAGPRGSLRGRRDRNETDSAARARHREFAGFLGDVVISVETAKRSAGAEGHPTSTELKWLILHGILHLLGMDHETDHGEMTALELALRTRLGVDGASVGPRMRRAGSGEAHSRGRAGRRRR